MVNQIQENYVARETQMHQYLEKVRDLLHQFRVWKAIQNPREENAEEDALANLYQFRKCNRCAFISFRNQPDQERGNFY